jgi:protein-disulfide isomerase
MAKEIQKKSRGGVFQIVMMVLLVGAAFAIGSMWTQLRVLKGGQNAQVKDGQVVKTDLVELIKGYAKEVKLDEKDFVACLDEGKYAQAVQDDLVLAQKLETGGTPTFFINGYKVVGAREYAVFQSVFEGATEVDGQPMDKLDEASWQGLIADPAIVKGSDEAPIVLVEFTDYECPFCAEYVGVDAIPSRPIDQGQTYKQILENYVNTGKVKYILKDLALHGPTASTVAQSARCAGDQGKYWEMHDKLFENQVAWSEAELN